MLKKIDKGSETELTLLNKFQNLYTMRIFE